MREDINGLTRFKNQIFMYGIVFASVIEAGSLIILGPNWEFAYGIVLGTCIAIVNFYILVYTSKKVLNTGKPLIGAAGYILRLCVYGYAFYMALKVSLVSGLGAALGFLTLKLAVYLIYMVIPAFKKRKELKETR